MRLAILLPVAALLVSAPAYAQRFDSPAAARAVVQNYYAAIERGDFRSAYAAWDRDGAASGKSYAAFRQGFAATAHSRVMAGAAVDGDAGMSQRWINVPVDVYATLKNGRRQHFTGSYTLHRVVPGVGASASALRWHLYSAKLRAI